MPASGPTHRIECYESTSSLLTWEALRQAFERGSLRALGFERGEGWLRAEVAVTGGRAFSEVDQRAVTLLLEARAYKEIASELGVGAGAARGAVQRALVAMGLPTRAHAIWLGNTLARPPRAARITSGTPATPVVAVELHPRLLPFTKVERDVALAVALGRSNAEIANDRRVSRRTVANQIRAMAEKVCVSGRLELVRALAT